MSEATKEQKQQTAEAPAQPAGIDFVIYDRPYGLQPWQTMKWLRTVTGLEREATPQEARLYAALAAAQARVVELEAQADAEHETRRRGKK